MAFWNHTAAVKRARAGKPAEPAVRVAGLFAPGWQSGAPTEAKARSSLGDAVEGVLAEYIVLPADGVVSVPAVLHDTDELAEIIDGDHRCSGCPWEVNSAELIVDSSVRQ